MKHEPCQILAGHPDRCVHRHRGTASEISKTDAMPMETALRRWTIATWLLAGHGSEIETIDRALGELDPDAVLLQSIRRLDVRQVAAGLGFNHTWAQSHSPRSRLLRGSTVGLAVLTPHRIGWSFDVVVTRQRSTWSKHRRIAQTATVIRSDHSSYEFGHAVGPVSAFATQPHGAPPVRVHPARIDGDPSQAIELPGGATQVSLTTHRPIPDAAQLLVVTFEMPWVQGDFPVPHS